MREQPFSPLVYLLGFPIVFAALIAACASKARDISSRAIRKLLDATSLAGGKSQYWQFYYFESGANEPYCRKTFRSRKEMEFALARFLRLGGDDDLRVVSPGGSLQD
jgi:hypothetical protein